MTQILGQFCINVTDIDRSVKFWEDTIGIPLQHRTEIDQAFEAVHQADAGGSRLQLAQQKDQDGAIDMGDAMWKIYVNTSDCQAVYDRCMADGCESEIAPMRLDRWPVTVAFVKDPDGYLIELVEHHEGTRSGVPDPKAS